MQKYNRGMNVTIAGIIGVGKSTLVENLPGKKFYEPVDANKYLKDYYKNPTEYAFKMQVNLLEMRKEIFEHAVCETKAGNDVVCDRSLFEDYIFARLQLNDGYMDMRDFETYNRMHTNATASLPFPDLIIWLNCDNVVDIAMERMKRRGRGCEAGVPRDYMEKLNKLYLEYIPKLARKCPVVEVDASKDAQQVLSNALQIINKRRVEIDAMEPCYHGGW